MIFRRKKRRLSPVTTHPLRRRTLARRKPLSKPGFFSKKSSEPRPANRRRPLTGFWGKLKRPLILILAGGLIIGTVYVFFISEKMNIATIQVIEDGEVVEDHPLLSLFTPFKGSNLLLFDYEDLAPYLVDEYSHYASLQIQKQLPDTLIIQLSSYPVVANIIIETPDETETTFWLNGNGQVEPEDNEMELPTLRISADQTVLTGTQVITQERLAFALEAIQSYEDKFGMKVLHALYLADEREVHLWTERNFYVWLDMTNDLDFQLNKLKKALPQLNIYSEDLEYIDLRIQGVNGEKVIFKRTGSTL